MNDSEVFRLGELFCGPGGLACGALAAQAESKEKVRYRIRHQWANDRDADTCDTYRQNICPKDPESVIQADIRDLDMDALQPIDALAFGFPCNDFSVVGKQKGMDGKYGLLYEYGIKALQKFRPRWFVAENVDGLRSANSGAAFSRILMELRDAGYDITPHMYKFEDYGIPQSRHRIIIVGFRHDVHLPQAYQVPSPAPYAEIDNSCRHALEVPPISAGAHNHDMPRQTQRVRERLSYIRPGQNVFTADLPEELRLKINGARISQIYRRLDPDRPAYTVTGSGGGGTHIYHYHEDRALTNRERARLQTFADDFVFSGGRESVRRQIGMAVPCRAAEIIFTSILNTWAGIAYEGVEPNITL